MADRILVLEDEANLGATLVERLRREGYLVEWAKSAAEADLYLRAEPFALALLDVGLPDGNGFEVAARLRALRKETAIIFLTAFGSSEDRVKGLEMGAEDYIVKPFHLKELLLRIQNGLRRAAYLRASAVEAVQIGRAWIDFSRFEAKIEGNAGPLPLTHREAALLKLLYDRRGRVVSRDEILNEVWTTEEFPSPRTIDNFVLKLRRLVEVDPENPILIRSIRGVGYQLVLPET
jgi:two-component system alkaline phosphatase synthesis response regulator PhoP